ncbi:MAG: hypothetical protein H0V68_06215 [Actinobacteria bacterium]|nr:hypothetical protein [Actinomycetota bacterium]
MAVFIVATVTAAPPKPKPKPADLLRAYLVKMEPVASDLALRAEFSSLLAETDIYFATANEDPVRLEKAGADFRAAQARYRGVAIKALRVKPPAGLGEPHAAFVEGVQAKERASAAFARKIEAGLALEDVAAEYEFDYQIGIELANEDLVHWRTETTIRLRRAGVVVPRWVKEVGKTRR